MADKEDLRPGQQFGSLTVLEKIEKTYPNGRESQQYMCRCECGNKVAVLKSSLLLGTRRTCGCRNSRRRKVTNFNNMPDSQTPLYFKWQSVKHSRLPHDPDWDTFSNFKIWSIQHHYAPDKKLMLLDPKTRYWGPETCTWVDEATYEAEHIRRYVESRRRTSRAYNDRAKQKKMSRGATKRIKNALIPYKGQVAHTVKEWSEILGISTIAIYKRVTNTYTGDMEEAFQAPFKTRNVLEDLENHLMYIEKVHPEQLYGEDNPMPLQAPSEKKALPASYDIDGDVEIISEDDEDDESIGDDVVIAATFVDEIVQ